MALLAQADKVFFDAFPATAALNEVVNFYIFRVTTPNATGASIIGISFIYPVSHILGDMGKVF